MAPAPTEKVVRRISEVDDTPQTDLDPLFDSVDPEALNTLFENVDNGPDRSDGFVRFTHLGYDVTVSADGNVEVTD
jgi:hypothetical protein